MTRDIAAETARVESLATADNCPKCGVSLLGDPIPEASREHFGGKTHFRRQVGIYSREQDRTVAWRCPDCDYEEAR